MTKVLVQLVAGHQDRVLHEALLRVQLVAVASQMNWTRSTSHRLDDRALDPSHRRVHRLEALVEEASSREPREP